VLQPITELVNFIGLAVAIWLGLYVITRNPHSLIAWLTGVGLWLIGGTFLNILLALNPPPVPVSRPFWLRLLFPFWPEPVTEQGQNTWLLGWSIVPALLIWHHVTTLMRGRLNTWRKARIILGYAVAAAAVFYQSFTPLLYTVENGDPLYLNTLQAGPLYPFFGACLLLFSGWSLMNLLRSARAATAVIIRKQLVIHTGLGYAGGWHRRASFDCRLRLWTACSHGSHLLTFICQCRHDWLWGCPLQHPGSRAHHATRFHP